MLRNRVIYKREDTLTSYDQHADIRYTSDNEADEDGDDDDDNDSEFMLEIPYTSSSVDRSSIGSIPWADDAIKKNQLDWEKIERMLHGQEELTQEMELRNEILEWQRKFPQLIGTENVSMKNSSDDSMHRNSFNSLDIDSISNLSLNSIDEDDGHELYDNGEPTPTNSGQRTNSFLPKVKAKAKERQSEIQIMNEKQDQVQNRDIIITSMPIKLRQRYVGTRTLYDPVQHQVKPSVKSITMSPPPPTLPPRRLDQKHYPLDGSLSASIANHSERRQSQMRMPPILNVLESKRHFRDVVTGSNRSFVQLTHVQQAKSAAVTASHHQRSQNRQSSIWRLPLAAASLSSRFLNNRNTIILPSIHLETAQESHSRDKVVDLRYISSVPLGGSYGKGGSSRMHLSPQSRTYNRGSNITTPATTSSTGRSISAAVHPQSRNDFNAFYLPYSASKFKVLK